MHKRPQYVHCIMLTVVLCMFGATRTSAQASRIVIEGGKLVGAILRDYAAGKALDKVLGLDCEAELKRLEADLAAQLRKGTGDAQRLQAELAATRTQLSILRELLNSKPSADDLERFRRLLASDLDRIRVIQQQHEQRLADHGARIKRLEEGNREVEKTPIYTEPSDRQYSVGPSKDYADHEARIKKLEEQENRAREKAPISDEPSERQHSFGPSKGYNYRRQDPQSRRGAGNRGGVTMMVYIDGRFNEIRISETDNPVDADVGSFELEGERDRHIFRLLANTGGVVSIQGDGNTVHLPSHLCGRVRVIRDGRNNQVKGCR